MPGVTGDAICRVLAAVGWRQSESGNVAGQGCTLHFARVGKVLRMSIGELQAFVQSCVVYSGSGNGVPLGRSEVMDDDAVVSRKAKLGSAQGTNG